MSFDDEPEVVLPASASSVASSRSFDAPFQDVPSSIATMAFDDPGQDRKVLHFFVSCHGVDGNALVSPARSAQTLVRGAFNMLSSATAMNNTRSPRAKPPTEVNVEIKVTRETPIFGFGAEFPAHKTTVSPPLSIRDDFSVDLENYHESRLSSPPETALNANEGLLDSESYWSERRKSRNPRFSVGFAIHCKKPAEYDRHVQILVMIPDEGTSTNKNSHVFGYATTSFQELYTIATTGKYRQKMTLPVHSTVQEGVTVELQFANLQPQLHPLFHTQHHLFQSFQFYPLMREEHAETQAANAKLAIEEAAEVDFSVTIPLQLLRVCQSELVQMYEAWKSRYNYNRKKNCFFEHDAEALDYGHDVFRVQVVCGRNLKTKSSANPAASGELELAPDMVMRSSRTSARGSVVGGRGGLVNRIKAAKWGNVSSSSFGINDNDALEVGGEVSNSVHSFVVVKYENSVDGNHEYIVGKTNTEYDSSNPVWSTNKNATTKCAHGKPSVKYQTSQGLKSRVVVSPVNALKEFVFYRPSVPDQPLAGWLRFQVFNEHYGYMSGVENVLIGEVVIPLQSVRDTMTVEEKKVLDDDEGAGGDARGGCDAKPHQIVSSFTLVDWFDVRSPLTDEVSGQIQLRINILLANPLMPLDNDVVTTHVSESSRDVPRRYRRAEDCTPPPTDGSIDDEMPLSFLYPHVLHIRKQISIVADMIRVTEQLVEEKNTFKSSLDKKRADIQGIPTNLHVSYFRIFRSFGSDANAAGKIIGLDGTDAKDLAPNLLESFSTPDHTMVPETHATVTCGAPTAHAMGLSNCGLREMELEMQHFQTLLEKISVRSLRSPRREKEEFISEDSSDFFYPPLEDEKETEVEDDALSTDSVLSLDAPASNGSTNLAPASPATPVEPVLKRKPSKYSVMARKAAAARVKALPKNRFVKKKSFKQHDRRNSDEKAASYAKYPPLRVDLDKKDSVMSFHDAVQMQCRLEMLRSEYYLRKSVAVSQSVSSLVTCFIAELDLCLQEQNEKVLDQLAKVGFLVGWESLISSHGKELRMISDAWVAIKCLESFSLKLCEGADMEVVVERQNEVGYIIRIPVPQPYFALLPERLRHGGLVSVTSVLFTQGINEMQSLANMVGHSGVSIQRKINSTSFRTILEYYNRFTEICGIGMSEVNVGSHPDEILRNLRASVESENSASKNTCILLHAADAVRSLNGGRVTYCKSGKDRTAMSTTLEQARLLVQRKRDVLYEIESGSATEFGPLEEVKDVANIMREFGVRIHIAKKNVGRFKYSFNSLQRKLLPEIYRPPFSTIQDMVTSVTARDS